MYIHTICKITSTLDKRTFKRLIPAHTFQV